ncbi:MAG: hypothetical protein DMG88_20155 [Acidobacteria bacterium]|nr:MAG: hypothetical protein DMG88_20155 [Acidobacteriota bacterium]
MIAIGTLALSRLDRSDASDARAFFVPRLACCNRTRNSCHHSRISVLELGLARVPAARAGVFLNLEPLVGTLLGVVILGESLGVFGVLGGAMVLFAAAYFSWPKTP